MKKRVVFYTSSLAKGGAQRVIVNLAESLVKKGYPVTIVTTMKGEQEYKISENIKRVYSDITDEEITDSRIKNFWQRVKKLRRIWKEEQPGILVSFIGKNNFMSLITAAGLNIPVVTSVRGEPTEEYYNGLLRFLSKTLMGCSAGLILQTPDAFQYFPKWIQKKSVLLENPLNPEFIDEYYTGERTGEIVTVGRLDQNKNQKLIVDAFLRIAGEFPEIKLILYGEGEDRKGLQEYVKNSNYPDRIFLPGAIKDVKEKIRRAKIFVLSSNTEGMPNALLEAMALGIPSISTDCPCGGPRMLMEGKENGILVPVGQTEPMAEAMKVLLTDDELWKKYSKNSYQLSQELHPDKVNKKWEEYLLSKMK